MLQKQYRVPKDVKEQIIERVRKEGKPAAQIAKEHGVKPTTVYSWLERKANQPGIQKELTKLKKERQILLGLIGNLTVQLSKTEKKEAGL